LVRASAALLLAGTATSLGAQERTLFTLNSTVDKQVLIVMRGRDVQVRGSGLDASYRPNLQLREALPRANGNVFVRLTDGRGTMQVIEQPTASNGYQTIIRITDPRSGADQYGLVATWQPTGNSGYGGYGSRDDDRYDQGRGRGNNCDHPNRNNGRGRDDDRCDYRNGRDDNDRWDNRTAKDRYESGMLRWSGDIDDVSEIRIQGRKVQYLTRSGAPVRNARYDIQGSGLPRRDAPLSLGVSAGRGRVEVVQQPSRRNDYTAIIRVTDPRSGYGLYDFNLAW
jgi:hypothetical protein